MEYKFNGKLTADDFFQAKSFYMKEKFFEGRTLIKIIILIILIIGYFIYTTVSNNKIRFYEDLLPILFFVIVVLFSMLFFFRRLKGTFKKIFETDKISHEEKTFIVNENEISISSESSSVKITKDKINKIKYDKDSIYIFISENHEEIIKSRYLKDLTEFNDLKDFIKLNYL
jgi:hypothetical protein